MIDFYTLVFCISVMFFCIFFSVFIFLRNLKNIKLRNSRVEGIISSDKIIASDYDSSIVINRDVPFVDRFTKFVFLYDSKSVFMKKNQFLKLFYISVLMFLPIIVFLSSYIYFLHLLFAVLLGWIFVLRFIVSRNYNSYRRKIINQLPDVIFMMARSLKIGVSLSKTFELISRQAPEPTKTLFSDLVKKIAVGKDFSDALDELADGVHIKEYTFFSIIIKLQSRTGGGLAEILDGFASNIRKRIMARKKAVALASEARMSCYVLSALPIFMAFIIGIMNPSYISVLYKTNSGIKLLYAAVILFLIGVCSMVFVTKRTLR
ncbi:type II secretion system F family protein [Acetobacter conturbans]|uniref:Type II secretion system protein GspF domain-containing protein n=1 Tax=Acetobacter conturbans TaxID=1737472 RepID=A0ABX0K1T7_9PROT|nr:type II secretion system F family protein [Acetobacter conturbans]NHN89701.1 hypothetical protein [Acetobacter conturbans]